MSRKWTLILVITVVATATPTAFSQFWPEQATRNGGCGNGGCGADGQEASRIQKWQAHADLIHQQGDLIAARNDAWPKPFQCYDRQAYHNIWVLQSYAGWCNECTLSNDQFDPETNELNRAGRAKVAGIMNNLPTPARQVLVYHNGNQEQTEARIQSVNANLQKEFGDLPSPVVSFTRRLPQGMSGLLVEDTQTKFIQALPPPGVPKPDGAALATQ